MRTFAETNQRVEAHVLRNATAGCSTAWISDRMGLSHMQACRHLDHLCKGGRIVATTRGGEGNRWVHMHAIRSSGLPLDEVLTESVDDMEAA